MGVYPTCLQDHYYTKVTERGYQPLSSAGDAAVTLPRMKVCHVKLRKFSGLYAQTKFGHIAQKIFET